LDVDLSELWNDSKIVSIDTESTTSILSQTSSAPSEMPASIPAYIQAETLRPEVVVPQRK
jgi:hypothetical protein